MGLAESDLNDDEDYFAVMLPDDVIEPTASMSEMIQVRQEQGGSESLAMEVDPAHVFSYGVFDVETASDARVKGRGHGQKACGRGYTVESGGYGPLSFESSDFSTPFASLNQARVGSCSLSTPTIYSSPRGTPFVS